MRFAYHRSYRGPLKLAVIDLAGTVIDYGSCAPADAFVQLFEHHGIRVTPEEARGPMGMHKRDHIRVMTKMPAIAKQWLDRKGGEPTDADVDALYEEFVPLQMEVIPRHAHLIPGTLEAVEALRGLDLGIAVTTGYNDSMMGLVLNAARVGGFVPDVAISAAHVDGGRPAPWMIFRAMEKAEIYPPAAVIKIGDTLADIEAGLNAGTWSVGVLQTGNMLGLSLSEVTNLAAEDLAARLEEAWAEMTGAGAHYAVASIKECVDVVCEINERLTHSETP